MDVYELGVRAHFLFLGFVLGLTLGFDLWISWKLPTGFFMELDKIFNFILGCQVDFQFQFHFEGCQSEIRSQFHFGWCKNEFLFLAHFDGNS